MPAFVPAIEDALNGGADRVRTCDPHNAIVVLYQLSYDPNQSGGQFNESGGEVKVIYSLNPASVPRCGSAQLKLGSQPHWL